MPIITHFFRSRYNKTFDTAENAHLFRGIFDSMDSAIADVPPNKTIGYDHSGPANMYRNRMSTIYTTDYPVLFWLQKIIGPQTCVFDWGGHVGVSYYAYRNLLDWPANASWVVCDVPAVVDQGKLMAEERGETALSFTTEIESMDGCGVILASGSLQYIEQDLSDLLSTLTDPPAHLIINLLPVHAQFEFVTLQNIGTAYCPYRIFKNDKFVQSLVDIGYSLVDRWENPEKSCFIPFDEEYSVEPYSGFYFSSALN